MGMLKLKNEYKLLAETPLGNEEYVIYLNEDNSGYIENSKNRVVFNNAVLTDHSLLIDFPTNIPMTTNVVVKLFMISNKITGSAKIGDFADISISIPKETD